MYICVHVKEGMPSQTLLSDLEHVSKQNPRDTREGKLEHKTLLSVYVNTLLTTWAIYPIYVSAIWFLDNI